MRSKLGSAAADSSRAVNGLVELLPLDDEHLIAMERSFSVGAPGTGNTIKLYEARLPHGRRSVVLISDNNFAASQFTQFLLFTLDD